MDYSAAGADEHAGSPWATSPQHSRTSFGARDVPDPDSPIAAQPSYSQQGQGESQSTFGGSQDGTVVATENGEGNHQQVPDSPTRQPQSQDTKGPQQGGQTQGQTAERYRGQGGRKQQQPQPKPQYKLQAKVTALERTGRKDPILHFDVYTNLPTFRTTQFRDVRRTHGEFEKLGEHLISANPEALVPAVPPAVTAAGAGTDEDEHRVKANIQRWLNVVCSNEVLMRDEEMVFFVESDAGYSPVVRRKQPATGVRRKVIKQFAPPPDDTPELADARPIVKMFYLETMGTGQKIDKVVKARRALGLSESTLGLTLSQMSPQEAHPGLSTAYRKLGATVRAVGDFHLAQGTFEASTLSDPLVYHSSDAFIVKETLTNRQILMRDLEQAQKNTRKKLREADHIRASSSVKRDKVDDAIAQLEEAKRIEEGLGKKVVDVTGNLVKDQRAWFERTGTDLRAAVRDYVMRQIESERRTLATLEAVRPDIRAIDNTGGLSRLGREAHPKIRRSSLASSQGPKGDAWSGVARKPDGVRRSESGNVSGLPVTTEEEEGVEAAGGGRERAGSSVRDSVTKNEEEDRIDARNAASRLAQTTF
ncbi:vacuolar protein sorting-associated protein Vps17 [Tothia fuscella]|uniref:Vacuolar protein sorting-associated protein 17 n=1 Tax=Tothia fuscella TaxID=1048955 RepID=A0A9P4TU96_9PEZI|nr:vacuolar protein sorting-associated protein Vps17 [Tothia fuscella]